MLSAKCSQSIITQMVLNRDQILCSSNPLCLLAITSLSLEHSPTAAAGGMTNHARQLLAWTILTALATSKANAHQEYSTAGSSSSSSSTTPVTTGSSSTSSSSHQPYDCFYNECPATPAEQIGDDFASCLKSGVGSTVGPTHLGQIQG
jgi:hypothetical protein